MFYVVLFATVIIYTVQNFLFSNVLDVLHQLHICHYIASVTFNVW